MGLSLLIGFDPENALQLVVDLDFFFGLRGRVREAMEWYERALAQTAGSETRLRARALREASDFALFLGDRERALELVHEGLTTARRLGDRREEAAALSARTLGRYGESLVIYRDIGDEHGMANALHQLGDKARDAGDLRRAEELLEESLSVAAKVGSAWHRAATPHSLADCVLDAGQLERAASLYRESLELGREIDSLWVVTYCFGGLAAVAARRGALDDAAHLWGAAENAEAVYGFPMERNERGRYERVLDPFTERAWWTQACEEGRRMTLDEAVRFAVSID